MIMQNHLLRCHPFAQESSHNVTWVDDDTEMYHDIRGDNSDDDNVKDKDQESIDVEPSGGDSVAGTAVSHSDTTTAISSR